MPPLLVTVMVKQGKVVQMGRWGWGRQVCGSRSTLCGMEQSMHYAIVQPRAGVSGPLWHGLGLSRLEPHVLLHQAKKAQLPGKGPLSRVGVFPSSGLECAPGIEANSFLGPGSPLPGCEMISMDKTVHGLSKHPG